MAWPLAVEILPKVVVEPPYISGLIWPAISRWLDGVRLSLARHHGEEAIQTGRNTLIHDQVASKSLTGSHRARSAIFDTFSTSGSLVTREHAVDPSRCPRVATDPTKVLNSELEGVFRRWYPQFRPQAA